MTGLPEGIGPSRGRRRALEILVLLACLALSGWIATTLDLEPRVESDFFFASDDPQLRAAREIGELFPGAPQILVASRSEDRLAPEAVERTRELSEALRALDGVTSVRSLTHGPASPAVVPDSPAWSRLLLGDDPHLALLVVEIAEEGQPETVAAVERVLTAADRPSFSLGASGVPWVVEHIRRRLARDLEVFSLASVILLLLASVALHRSVPILFGTVAACTASVSATLGILRTLDVPVGLLTANLVTIVFVLTLSHTLYLGAARRRWEGPPGRAARRGVVREVFGPSFWCMATTLCGFLSLLAADARPLRELGTAGSIGTVAALLAAYALFPLFLSDPWSGAAPAVPVSSGSDASGGGRRRIGIGWTVGIGALAGLALLGLPAIETDPPLPGFFAASDPLRDGLERIDRSGGSSPLELVVADPAGGLLDSREGVDRLTAVQLALETDPEVGTSLSLAVLVEEARRHPLAAYLDSKALIGFLTGPMLGEVGKAFVSDDRRSARFVLRMRELGRESDREAVVARLVGKVEEAGLEVRLVGGLYDLQGRLGDLVEASLVRGLGGLLLLFAAIGLLASRNLRAATVMGVSLAAVPVILLGGAGWLGMPLDLVAAPGVNVAIAIGVDAMLHLAMAARRNGGGAEGWAVARRSLRAPIVEAAVLVAVGFGVFGLSSFPPTRRFGLLVAVGAVASALVALRVLPRWAAAEPEVPRAEP